MAKSNRRRTARPRDVLFHEARMVGCVLTSVGDYEQLAGIDIQSDAERRELWWRFHTMFAGPSQVVVDAVMDHCAAIALARLERGELCLLGEFRVQ
jgi:hypothetical protein